MNLDHLVLDRDTCKCLHCGYQYRINLPAPVGIFDAIVKQFIKLHRKCKKHESA